ncbi:MAG TPA: GNAT family N-acetyltransferase [Microthrixaceae bacterium]|nr:GNAT family N-acetyltransferase [Microthrixaceae bacterium]
MIVLPEIVVSPRLTLRRWLPVDAPLLGAAVVANTEHLRPWMPWIADEPMSDDDRRDLVVGWEAHWHSGGDVIFGAFLADVVVGGCGLHRRAGPESLEIGYWVHVHHLRRGYATEIARELTNVALSVPGIARVEIHHDAANLASRGVPESLGFRLDGETPDEPTAPGEVGIDVAWSTTIDDWQGVST